MLTWVEPEEIVPEAGETLSHFEELEAAAVKERTPAPAFETATDWVCTVPDPAPARNCRPDCESIRYGPGSAMASVTGTLVIVAGRPCGVMVIATLAV